jgi:DSF synthase
MASLKIEGNKMDNQHQKMVHPADNHYSELDIEYNAENHALWCYKRIATHPCCTPELFTEMQHLMTTIENCLKSPSDNSIYKGLRYFIIASRIPGVFNLGGNINYLLRLIRTGNREGLKSYVKSCIDMLYASYHLPLTTISLVQGDAFGGGFEGALVSRVIIAERQAQMGLPEILFNFFPGMGAYSLLARRLGPAQAERLILSGRLYSAEELYEMGVVDVLAENGEGELSVNNYIKKQNRANNTYQAIHKARQVYQPLNTDELLQIADIWLDTALGLSERDLRVMERIAQSQEKLVLLRPSAEVKQLA